MTLECWCSGPSFHKAWSSSLETGMRSTTSVMWPSLCLFSSRESCRITSGKMPAVGEGMLVTFYGHVDFGDLGSVLLREMYCLGVAMELGATSRGVYQE